MQSGDLRTILDVINELCQKYVVSVAFGKGNGFPAVLVCVLELGDLLVVIGFVQRI